MHDNGEFPDDVPIADAVEQQRTTDESSSTAARPDDADVPLEATDSDWLEQQQTVLDDSDFDQSDDETD
ncbi:hypothetical protein AAHS21_10525 [Mycobacterium sp. 050272]|uniref:hypothetical protein n=1 Tax=Mycobacterium sp. 050272 TaxID=3142488 RepID=UPI00318FDD94